MPVDALHRSRGVPWLRRGALVAALLLPATATAQPFDSELMPKVEREVMPDRIPAEMAKTLPLTTAEATEEGLEESAEDPIKEGRRHFKKGVRLYRQGASDAAFAEFSRAYQVAPHFRILYNLAQVQAQRQMYVEALTFFRRYLDEATAPISSWRRRRIVANQAELMKLVGRLRLVHSARGVQLIDDDSPFPSPASQAEGRRIAVGEATLFVDGVLRGTVSLNTPILLDAGVHQIRIEVPGFHPQVRSVTLLGGEDFSLTLLLDALPAPKPAARPTPPLLHLLATAQAPVRSVKSSLGRTNTSLWLSLSATGALLGATAALGLATRSSQQTLNRELASFPANRDVVDTKRNEVRLLAQATDMVGLFAVVSAGLSTYLFASRPSTASEEEAMTVQAHPHASGMSLLCTGRF